jgi:hypothetical protein
MSETAIYFGIVPTTLLLIVGLAYTLLAFYRFQKKQMRHDAARVNRDRAGRAAKGELSNAISEVRQQARA